MTNSLRPWQRQPANVKDLLAPSERHDIVAGYECPVCGGRVFGATDNFEAAGGHSATIKVVFCRQCNRWHKVARRETREITF